MIHTVNGMRMSVRNVDDILDDIELNRLMDELEDDVRFEIKKADEVTYA